MLFIRQGPAGDPSIVFWGHIADGIDHHGEYRRSNAGFGPCTHAPSSPPITRSARVLLSSDLTAGLTRSTKLIYIVDMAKADLHPASSIFLPLPNSANHHLVTRITGSGVVFEVLQLVKVQAENGAGWKLGIGERVGIDRGLISGRKGREGDGEGERGKRKRGEGEDDEMVGTPEPKVERMELGVAGVSGEAVLPQVKEGSAFELDEKHLRDVFIYSKCVPLSFFPRPYPLRARLYPLIFLYPMCRIFRPQS